MRHILSPQEHLVDRCLQALSERDFYNCAAGIVVAAGIFAGIDLAIRSLF